jgi:hypothetical protein
VFALPQVDNSARNFTTPSQEDIMAIVQHELLTNNLEQLLVVDFSWGYVVTSQDQPAR